MAKSPMAVQLTAGWQPLRETTDAAREDPSRPLLSEDDVMDDRTVDVDVVDDETGVEPNPRFCRGPGGPPCDPGSPGSMSQSPWMARRLRELETCAEQTAAPAAVEGEHGNCMRVGLSLLAGVLLWLVTLSLDVGFATFCFLEMPSRTPLAISMQVLGTSIVYLWLSARSCNPASCVQASPIPAIYISMFIQATRTAGVAEDAQLSTVLAFIWTVSFVQGFAFVLCARYNMGKVLQYFPVSVTTGYNGGIGLLIGNASLSMMAGMNPLKDPSAFMTRQPVLLALPGVLLAAVLYPLSLTQACSGPAFKVLPIIVVITVFYVVLFVTGTSLDEAREQGWIFPYFGYSKPLDVVSVFDPRSIAWDVLGQSAVTMGPPMTFIAMVAQYASLGAVLMQINDSTKDADDETRHLGHASMLSGLVGAMPNLSGMAPSNLLMALVGPKGASGLTLAVCGGLHLWLFVSGFPLVSFLPKCSIAGCLLMPISFRMIRGALFESLASSTWSDYAVIWVMSWTTLFMNIQWGLSAGFILTVFQMLIEYSHFDVVNRRESLRQVCTAKERDFHTRELLEMHGDEVVSYRLKGVLFFGNCVSLKLELNALFDGGPLGKVRPPKFIVVDFSEVSYVDSSVWEVLAAVSRRARSLSASEVLLCGLSGPVLQELACQGERLLSDLTLDVVNHSYHLTMEGLEDRILATFDEDDPVLDGWEQLAEWVAEGLPRRPEGGNRAADAVDLRLRLQRYFQQRSYKSGDMVQHEGAEAAAFYWVESGEFHVFSQKQSLPRAFGEESPKEEAPETLSPASRWKQRRGSLNLIVGPLPEFARGCGGVAEALMQKAGEPQESRKALIHRKLTNGFVAGTEIFSNQEGPVVAYTSLQCKHQGSVFRLAKADFDRLRSEDSELCVALLLVVASHREGMLRRYLRYRFEPEEVEVHHGARRKFTVMTSSQDIVSMQSSRRTSAIRGALSTGFEAFATLRSTALKARDNQAQPPSKRSSAWQLDSFT